MGKVSLIALAISAFSFSGSVFCQENDRAPQKNERGFYTDEARGWFFYEDPEENKKEEKKPPPSPQAQQTAAPMRDDEKVKIDSEWLKKNYPKFVQAATDNPSDENVLRVAWAQRLMLDMSNRFANRFKEVTMNEEKISEELRRPTTTVGLTAFNQEVVNAQESVFKKIAGKAHIWFFYKSTCPFCAKQIPILQTMSKVYGFDVLAVSMDGVRMAGTENFSHRFDSDLSVSKMFDVKRTPTTLLMKNDGNQYAMLSDGLETLPRLSERVMMIAEKLSLISEEELSNTKRVLDLNTVKDVDGTLILDKDKAENDPNYFIEVMREQLNNY